MEIQLIDTACLNEVGGRANNEDSVYPEKGASQNSDRLFMVCDGVGGAAKGEVASRLVCESIGAYFKQNQRPFLVSRDIHRAIEYTEQQFDQFLEQHPESKGMATTLTLINFHKQGATIAWAGDSRIYHIRSGHILFQSRDHSLVNQLLKRGEISSEEVVNHPQRHVITKAIKGLEEPANPEVALISEIKSDDYFMLCTDGILEHLTNQQIREIFSGDHSMDLIKEKIQEVCDGRTRDNYSLYIIQVNVTNDQPKLNEKHREDKASTGLTVGLRQVSKPQFGRLLYGFLFVLALILIYFLIISPLGSQQSDMAAPGNSQEQTVTDPIEKPSSQSANHKPNTSDEQGPRGEDRRLQETDQASGENQKEELKLPN
jgi:protein phosphatase